MLDGVKAITSLLKLFSDPMNNIIRNKHRMSNYEKITLLENSWWGTAPPAPLDAPALSVANPNPKHVCYYAVITVLSRYDVWVRTISIPQLSHVICYLPALGNVTKESGLVQG